MNKQHISYRDFNISCLTENISHRLNYNNCDFNLVLPPCQSTYDIDQFDIIKQISDKINADPIVSTYIWYDGHERPYTSMIDVDENTILEVPTEDWIRMYDITWQCCVNFVVNEQKLYIHVSHIKILSRTVNSIHQKKLNEFHIIPFDHQNQSIILPNVII